MAAKPSELRLRIISALALAALAFAAVWAGGTPFAIFISMMAFIVFVEWTEIAGLSAFENVRLVASVAMLLPMLILIGFGGGSALVALLVCGIATYFVCQSTTRETANWTAAAVVYCGLAAIALVGLRNSENGIALILLLFAVVWGTDIGAYFVGRRLGGPKLAPKISPGKTQSGAIGGLVIAVVAALAVNSFFDIYPAALVVFIAVIVSIISQIGDLFESYLKRRFGVKDSGTILPGHGGMFDRVDGLMPAAIALFLIIKLL
jgi:phosphatidate cytidylyltransferase